MIDLPVRELWSIDQIIGYLFSTSYASKSVLGDRAPAFEEDLREALSRLSADGWFEKEIEHTAIIARR
jgi:hypothetical protein